MFDPKQAIEWLIAKQALCLKMELPFTELVDEIHEYIDQFSEQDLTGFADFLALYAELLDSVEADQLAQVEPVISLVSEQLAQLGAIEPAVMAHALVAQLQHPAWPEPVEEEDAAFLLEILESDCSLFSPPPSVAEPIAEEETEHSVEVQTQLQPAASIKQAFPDLYALLEAIGRVSDELPPDTAETLYELIDRYSEEDWNGVADLLALYGELLIQLPEMDDLAVAAELNQALLALLRAPSEELVQPILTAMSVAGWPEPVPEEDTEFLKTLLLADVDRLDADVVSIGLVEDEDTQPEENPVTESDDSELLPHPPLFCQIDFSLLEMEGPQVDPAVVAMLSQSILSIVPVWQSPTTEQPDLQQTIESLQPVLRALETINLIGATLLVTGLQQNLEYIQTHQISLLPDRIASVQACLTGLVEYLENVGDYERQQNLLDQFVDSELPSKPGSEETSFIMGLLALASLQTPESLEQKQAVVDDVDLTPSAEVDPQLLEMLHSELPQLSEEFLSSVQRLIKSDAEALRTAQRAVHTLKGLANMAGIRGMANLAHGLEDLMDLLADAERVSVGAMKHDLLEAADCLAAMSDAITDSLPAPDNALQVLQRVMDWDYRLKTEGISLLDRSEAANTSNSEPEDTAPAAELPVEQPRNESALFKVPGNILDNLFRLAGESSTLNTQLDEEITHLRSYARTNRERHRNLQRVLFELEQQFSDQMNLQPQLDELADEFDPLEMDRYNEMHSTLSRVQEAVADVREVTQDMDGHIQSLSTLHIAQSGLQKETLQNVLNSRLVEVRSISSRLQRITRQACRATGKEAELIIKGEATLVDSHILNQLADPLLHIIRNAIDHGLESSPARVAAGKSEEGRITLSFSLKDDQIHVHCEDDGGGINTERVLAVACQKQLIDPEITLSEEDVQRLILIPGFSTRDQISQLSGRGIGMDVVYQQILRLQGTLDITSKRNQGTCFQLSMPASSLIIRTLLVRCGHQIFALAGHGIEQSVISLDGRLMEESEGLVFEYEGEHYPTYMLENLLQSRPNDYQAPGAVYPVLLVTLAQGEKVAVLVKEVIAHRELAFKQLSEYLPDLPGIPGMTILANGETAPIVDLPERIRYQRSQLTELRSFYDHETAAELPRILIVDDSLSARKTLQTLLADSGYEVSTAIDGLDALNQIRKQQPDLVLTDMEMPRMNGVELTHLIRQRDETSAIPVIMITSRSTEKHRQEADDAGVSVYLTKPWSENRLLDQVDSLLTEMCV